MYFVLSLMLERPSRSSFIAIYSPVFISPPPVAFAPARFSISSAKFFLASYMVSLINLTASFAVFALFHIFSPLEIFIMLL